MHIFKRFMRGDPLRKACTKFNMDIIFNIFENIKGENCRIQKDGTGANWKIIIDGSSDTPSRSAPWNNSGGLGLDDGTYYFVTDVKWENNSLQVKRDTWVVEDGEITITEGNYETIISAVAEMA